MKRSTKKHVLDGGMFLTQGEEFYAKAADEFIVARKLEPLTYKEIGQLIGRHESVVKRIVQSREDFLRRNDPAETFTVDWQRGSHGTVQEIRIGAVKLLSENPAQVIRDLPTTAVDTLANAAAHEAIQRRQNTTVRITDPPLPHALLRKVESDRVKILAAVQLMVGHWYDHRHDANEEEVMLARDTMAETVIEVEKLITSALREEVKA